MIKKITELDGSYHYEDLEGNKFSRIVAGLAWPALKAGFLVVIGEDYHEDPSLKCRHLRALAEGEESDTERLFKKCLDLRERYWVERILGDMDNEPVMELLRDFNKSLDGARPLSLYDASFPEDLRYQVQLIKGVTSFNRKTLHLNQCNALRGYLSNIALEDAQQGKASDHPAVMALGYALSYIRNHPKDPVKDRIRQIPQEEDYNPLTYGLGPGE